MHARTARRGWFRGRGCYCADDWYIDQPTWIPLDISDCMFLRKSLTLYHEYYWSDVQIGLLGYMAGESRPLSHQTRFIQNWPFPSMWPFLYHDTSDITVSSGASTVFGWLANMTSVAGMLNWICLCITSIRCVPLYVLSGNLHVMLTIIWYYFSEGRFRRGLAVCLVSFFLSWNTSWIFSPRYSRPKVFPSPSCHTEAGFSHMRRGTGFCELYFLHPFPTRPKGAASFFLIPVQLVCHHPPLCKLASFPPWPMGPRRIRHKLLWRSIFPCVCIPLKVCSTRPGDDMICLGGNYRMYFGYKWVFKTRIVPCASLFCIFALVWSWFWWFRVWVVNEMDFITGANRVGWSVW